MPEPQFKTPLLYRYVRHPPDAGYLAAELVVSAGHDRRVIAVALGRAVHICIGVAFEERDLLAQFGEHDR